MIALLWQLSHPFPGYNLFLYTHTTTTPEPSSWPQLPEPTVAHGQ
jgi:hypothetical protein